MTCLETRFATELAAIRDASLYKAERIITSPQGVEIETVERGKVLNFCANNYLGLANHPEIIAAATAALGNHGVGMASVRFICGTAELHKELERAIASFLGTEDAILYSSCFDANTGLFETLLGEDDAVISDALNHASIIDGIRLCKAARFRFAHANMQDLERQLQAAARHRTRLIVTDGVFSMDGDIARLDEIVALAEQYGALVMVDDSHGTGVIGATGRGSGEHRHVLERIDIY
ncbi:MAG: 2-amino-3-ketobutyrate CoA ligase, partial [Proteobacteria bacterium]|nr:2-amino-3-ketobutyrate CoA ligase [Pseudomonadota bacterium]